MDQNNPNSTNNEFNNNLGIVKPEAGARPEDSIKPASTVQQEYDMTQDPKEQQNKWFNPQPNNNGFSQSITYVKTSKRRSKKDIKKTLMAIGVIFIVIILVIILIKFIFGSSSKLVCKSSEGDATIKYTDSEIKDFTSTVVTFDKDLANEYVQNYGIDQYIDDFAEWFEGSLGGTCTKK